MLVFTVILLALSVSAAAAGDCPEGSFTSTGSCIPCPRGAFSNEVNSRNCFKCPRGTYADEEGSTRCKSCLFNHFTYFDSSESEADCIGPRLVVEKSNGERYIFRSAIRSEVKFEAGLGTITAVSGTWEIGKSTGLQFELREGDAEMNVEMSEVSIVEAKFNNIFCYTGVGEGYVGTADTTMYGVKCLNWNDVPSMPEYNPDHNYCRSFGKGHKQPFCFIDGDSEPRAVACTVPRCVWNVDCKARADGAGYIGDVSSTEGGYTCQNWSSNFPHPHEYSVGDHNKCRNPDSVEKDIWCFTTNLFHRWDYCSVRTCDTKERKFDYKNADDY